MMEPTALDRRWIIAAVWLWLACCSAYFLTAPGRIDIVDGAARYDVTTSLLELGKPEIFNDYAPAIEGRGGRRYAFYPIGTSLIALPFVMAGGWLGSGSVESKQFAFSMVSVPFAAAAVAVFFLILGRLGCGIRAAVGWALALAFCTPMWVYAGSSFDQALQAFFLLVAVWMAIEALASDSVRWALVSGAAFAWLVNVQETYAVLAACLFDVSPPTMRAALDRFNNRVVRIIVALVGAGVAVVLAYNVYKFGNPLDTGRTAVKHPLIGNPIVGFAGLFISPAKSVFLYCPIYLFALLGVRRLLQRDRERFRPVFACLAVHIAMTASLKFWAGEWAWGPRYLVASMPLACLGLPFAVGSKLGRRLLWASCALSFAVQVMAISVDHQRYYVERRLVPYFWVVESYMYKDSPLLERPFEMAEVLTGRDLPKVRALVPGPRPFSMTSVAYGPSLEDWKRTPEWMREFLLFDAPRPWPLWIRWVRPDLRPGRADLMIGAGLTIGALSSLALLLSVLGEGRVRATHSLLASFKNEQVIET